jgi:hypothetical protein
MSTAVIEALVNARFSEREQRQANRDAAVRAEVFGWLDYPDPVETVMPLVFTAWCEMKSLRALPARPASVALFVLEHAAYDFADVAGAVQDISSAHVSQGFADPTATWPVPAAMGRIGGITPPRSWPKAQKQRFLELPVDLQAYTAQHEAHRDRAVRRAQNEAASARQELEKVRQVKVPESAAREADDSAAAG